MKKLMVLLALAIVLFGCTQPSGGAANTTAQNGVSGTTSQTVSVDIKGFAFNPATITVKQGQTVRWTNDDSVPHTVKFDSFQSQTLSNGDSYEHTFTEAPGEYDYSCAIHPYMTGKVIVTK